MINRKNILVHQSFENIREGIIELSMRGIDDIGDLIYRLEQLESEYCEAESETL